MMSFFEKYKKMAKDNSLKDYEKVGRKYLFVGEDNKEINIFPDIREKLGIKPGTVICDIGCGCSRPVLDLIDFSKSNNNRLILIDSKEMLGLLPDFNFIKKITCEFPRCDRFIKQYKRSIDYIICYSVIHCVFPYDSTFNFLDKAIGLLKNNGKMLIGDIPNVTKKKRFLSCKNGIRFYQKWSGGKKIPKVIWNELEEGAIDEGIIFAILQRYRNMGCETYLLPQDDGLPINKTREDILIVRL